MEKVNIQGFRGLNVTVNLKKVNIVVGENGTGKTSFLEALFLSTLFQSDMSENDINTLFLYAMSSGGDSLSAFSSLSDSTVVLDNNTVTFKKKDSYSLEVDINGEKVTEVNKMELLSEPLFSPSVKVYKKVDNGYFPVYISTFFDRSGNLERIFSIAKRKNRKIKTEFEILQDKYGQFKLYYDLLPAYVIGRGILKREMIKFGLKASNLLLIDEIEDSLHPDMIVQVLKEIREGNTQILLTTHVNEVIKMVNKIFDENEALVLYLTREGYKAYKLSEISEFEMPLSWLGYV
ncbi:AAA family ATPase [Acidianus sp. HS-5]|uniref:AAA family ATPase n=1 Tax=Acidianus sp. HS-5 TaxID=2886040 RepID=UPI001F2FBE05|nr:AAA family ATPase [Acidianus sp. HS-5]